MSGWGSGGGQWGTDDTVAGARLLYINRDVPNFRALVDVIDYRYAEVVAVSRQVEIGYDIDTAVGLQLDVLGASLGQAREAMADERYRRALRVQRAILSSGGTRSALVSTWNVWTTYALTSFHPAPPGDVWITGHAEREDEILLARYLQRAAAGGVIVNGYVVAPTETMLIGVHSFDSIADVGFHPDLDTLLDAFSGVLGTASGTTVIAGVRTFDGAADLLSYASPIDLTSSPFTFSIWFRPVAIVGTGYAIEIRGTGSTLAIGFRFEAGGVDPRIALQIGRATTSLLRRSADQSGLTAGVWHNIVCTYDDSGVAAGVSLYLDDVEVASYQATTDGSGAFDQAELGWTIGNRASASNGLNGDVRDLRVWPRVLTADERANVFAGYEPADYVTIDETTTDYSADPITGAAICASRIV